MNQLTDFGKFFRLEFRAAKLQVLNQLCAQYLTGFGSGFYEENTDFEGLIRRNLQNIWLLSIVQQIPVVGNGQRHECEW